MTCAIIFLTTLLFASYSIRKIIYISHKKHLFDEPSEDRKIHFAKTPNLGGVAIFATMIFVSSLFVPRTNLQQLNYIIASVIILFFLGLTDDLVGMNPFKKFFAQLGVAILMTVFAGFCFTNLQGIFGIYEIPYTISVGLSVLFILLIINAFNLIDGINCLAGSIGLLSCIIFSFCFWKMNEPGLLFLAVAMCGCLSGFLFYNRTPAKIFMGDTGALFLGFMIAIFSIKFIVLNRTGTAPLRELIKSPAAFTFALLIIPIFDTLRVFAMRIGKGKSPFAADRNHIHHRLIDIGFTHMQSTGILLLVNIGALALSISFPNIGTGILFMIISSYIITLNIILTVMHTRKMNRIIIKKPAATYKPVETAPSLKFLIEKTAFLEKHEVNDL